MTRLLSIGCHAKPVMSRESHKHECWEIVCYTYGRGVITLGDRPMPFEPGAIVCSPPGVPHSEISESGYANTYICVDRLPLRDLAAFSDDRERSFTGLAAMLNREWHLRRPGWQGIADALLAALVMHLERWRGHEPRHPVVERLERLMVDGMGDPAFDLAAVMRRLPLTPRHQRCLFRAVHGCAPHAHLEQLRIAEAKRLLLLGGFRVKEIAARVGFADPYHFSRVFRRCTGASPMRFAATPRPR